jgi:hypothetical protein
MRRVRGLKEGGCELGWTAVLTRCYYYVSCMQGGALTITYDK